MTEADISERNNKSNGMNVFRIRDDRYFVESSSGKICYLVTINNGEKCCSCGDYTSNITKEPAFQCKHILAVVNGNILNIETVKQEKPKLDERWITEIEGREFVKYPGLLDLGHQKGITKIEIEPLQYPTKENGQFAICKALIVSLDGKTFTDVGDANPENCSSKVRKHLLRMASTRAIARALRSYTNIGMTCLEELGDIDDSLNNDSGRTKTRSRRDNRAEPTKQAPPKQEQPKGGAIPDDRRTESGKRKEEKETAEGSEAVTKTASSGTETTGESQKNQKATDSQNQKDQAKPSEAQIKAIEKLAERRGINGEQLIKLFTDKFQKPYVEINADEAKNFIKHLQQAA